MFKKHWRTFLFEKVLYHRVYSYLMEHNLNDKRQYALEKITQRN